MVINQFLNNNKNAFTKIIKNKLYILNLDGKYIKIKQKKPKFINNIKELKRYK